MAYEVTATRKRPQTFDDLVGQEFIVATLKSSIKHGRMAPAYLFSGPRGVGKTSAARILAKAMNCAHGPTDEPCGLCSACQEIARGNALDVIEIDGASNTSVNDVRTIKDEVLFSPNSCRYKIYIIDEVHMLSNSAFNALLKTIEEPPPYIAFIFATTEVHKVPATIRSRCQQFSFRLISSEQIKQKLTEVARELNIQAEDRALFWMAKEATGSLRDAYTLLDQIISFSTDSITLERIREKLGVVGTDQINKIGELLINRDKHHILEYTAGILERGISVEQFVIDLAEYFRNLLFVKCGIHKQSLLSCSPESFSEKLINAFSHSQIEKAIELVLQLYQNLKFSLNSRFELELLMSRLADLNNLITPTDLLVEVRKVKADLLGSESPGSGVSSKIPEQRPAAMGDLLRPGVDAGGSRAGEENQSASPGEKERASEAEEAEFMHHLIEALKGKKFALAASLEKVVSWTLSENELNLSFKAEDKYSAEHVDKEKEAVAGQAARILTRPVRILVSFIEPGHQAAKAIDQRVEIVKKVFRGKIVKGE